MLTAKGNKNYCDGNEYKDIESTHQRVSLSSSNSILHNFDLIPSFDHKSKLRYLQNTSATSTGLVLYPSAQILPVLRLILIGSILLCISFSLASKQVSAHKPITGDKNFTFVHNGSFLQIDAGREWPFHSRREISFRFKTKSPHGLLIYQTFDHNKFIRDEDQDLGLDQTLMQVQPVVQQAKPHQPKQAQSVPHLSDTLQQTIDDFDQRNNLFRATRSSSDDNPNGNSNIKLNIRHLTRASETSPPSASTTLSQLSNSAITATASEKLVNSLFSSSPVAAINGNAQQGTRATVLPQAALRGDKNLLTASGSTSIVSQREPTSGQRGRILSLSSETSSFGIRSVSDQGDGSTILSSSAISSFSGSLYELYLKLENGRLKIMYEFGSKLNQTYCGKGLNDDKWHKVELRVDPDTNQMVLVLDQVLTVEIVRNHLQQEDEVSSRRNELVFTNSILYIGGLDNNASIVKNVKQRLHLAQFIGCIGQIMLRTDQHTESVMQPAAIDRAVLVKRGCINLCDTDNYCLHESTCVNYYTHTHCDCFGTNYEDVYCWRDKLTSLSMFGHSTLVHRIYDWRDRHHSSSNRLSMQFRTYALDSILFFAYGDLSAHQTLRSSINAIQTPPSPITQTQTLFPVPQVNISALPPAIHRPTVAHQFQGNSNYLAVSLSNGSVVVEVNFGDQPILLSSLLYDKIQATSKGGPTASTTTLTDGNWHNITFVHANKQLYLYLDDHSINYTIVGKNSHLYFDPSIYIGSVPNFLSNETRSLMRPLNLRHKFVGCLRSVYFNQHNILFSLKQNSSMVEYRDLLGRPRLDTCVAQEPSSLPLTLRSGKSYLTFQLSSTPQIMQSSMVVKESDQTNANLTSRLKQASIDPSKKLTKIEFEYKTSRKTHFLAGGHLRDLSYHDLGGFWTLLSRESCQLQFTMSSGLTYEPEQVIKLDATNTSCQPGVWSKVTLSILSGDKLLNISRSLANELDNIDQNSSSSEPRADHKSFTLVSSVELLHQVQLGGDLAKFGESSSIPFSGCLRNIRINNRSFDSRDFVTSSANMAPLSPSNQNHSISSAMATTVASGSSIPSTSDVISNQLAQGYVTIDSCQLVNQCTTFNPCKNNGICKVNELGEPDCDCSKTGYTGKRCHFSIYKQSCQDLYLSGQRKSSYYLIDLDRNGPLRPIRVRCNMEENDNGLIETSISHNLPAEYLIRRSQTTDYALDVTYIAFHHMYTSDGFYVHDDDDNVARASQDLVLKTLIEQSLHCKQYIKYECRSAPLNLGNRTWFEASYPRTHKIQSLDGVNYGKCECASSEKRCLDPVKNCNCDGGESIWTDDSHELTDRSEVGITRIVMLKQEPEDLEALSSRSAADQISTSSGHSQSRFTLSDLKCYGTKRYGSHHEITFKTSDAYIEVPGWRRGDLSFSFRTASNPPAIILFQLATSRNHGYFRLTLISDNRLLFEFIINRRPRKLYLSSSHKLNNGEWQQVFIEYDSVNLRLTVNDDSIMIDLDLNDHLGTFEGPLFVGGAPSKYLVGDMHRRNGFTGCFRGLNINDKSIELRSYLSPSMPSVISGCQPSCTKNICQNDGKCIELWGNYECECSNSIAHSGNNCEININTNSITFVTQAAYYVQQSNESSTFPPYLTKNILLNLRTYQETALILYAVDRFNNFIQLHKNGSSLVLTYNSNNTIVATQVPINDDDSASDMAISNVPQGFLLASTRDSTSLSHISSAGSSSIGARLDSNLTSGNLALNASSLGGAKSSGPIAPLAAISILDRSIRVSNTSGSGKPVQVKIERHRLRTTFYVNNNFVVIEKPLIFLTNYSMTPWTNPELESVRPQRSKLANRLASRIYLANIDETYFSTRLPGITGCIQGFSIDNQLFDFNRAHLTGDFKGEYRIGCKMRCDSFPCKNQGTCIENWKEDKIQCKCDATSYVGPLCDEDVAAIFNGQSSYFVYHLPRKFTSSKHFAPSVKPPGSQSDTNSTEAVLNATTIASNSSNAILKQPEEERSRSVDLRSHEGVVEDFEISLAFSTDTNQTSAASKGSAVQVIALVTRANSSLHFFLGLTSDGSLLIQEDYGNSMSLSRIIKKNEQPYNDGFRHMVKYARHNQTIQIIVDHQTYLPTMSVITSNHASSFSNASLISVGTAGDRAANLSDEHRFDGNFTNYVGCISNLVIKMDDTQIEPLSEAFGQNLETVNVNLSTLSTRDESATSPTSAAGTKGLDSAKLAQQVPKLSERLVLDSTSSQDDYGSRIGPQSNAQSVQSRMLNVINKLDGKEVNEDIETIVVRDVEQGKCAAFKRSEVSNEKRSVNEPKHTPLLDPRPVYMDPPRVKPFKRHATGANERSRLAIKKGFGPLFYCSATLLIIVTLSFSIYAYVLQVRYKSEKFRCETPFFHRQQQQHQQSGSRGSNPSPVPREIDEDD